MNALLRDSIFFSYSHKDKLWLGKLKTMLAPGLKGRKLLAWDDTMIKSGSRWKDEIDSSLRKARIAVLLVSSDFLNSRFITNNELPPILEAAATGGLIVLWIYVRPAMVQETDIADFQAAHDVAVPLSRMSPAKREAVMLEIANTILESSVAAIPPPTLLMPADPQAIPASVPDAVSR
jgi:hypothetical protein